MPTNLVLSASVDGGNMNLSFFKTQDNVFLGGLHLSDGNPEGQLNIPLEENEDYFLMYTVVARKNGCVYDFNVTHPPAAEAHIRLPLQKGEKDFNSIPFRT